MEKSKGICRILTIPDAIDSLVLQSAVNKIQNTILDNAPSNNVFYQQQQGFITGSKKRQLNPPKITTGGTAFEWSSDYDSGRSWLNFQKEIFHFTDNHKFIVVTDIANFFDHIDTSIYPNILSSFDDVKEVVTDLILFVLSFYHWRPDYTPANTVGLPQMNFDAPRLLAHCFLYDLDRVTDHHAPGAYARYMDDIDVGVSSVPAAKQVLSLIDETLRTRGVRLNSGKTRILTALDAREFYFVDDNRRISLAADTLERKSKQGSPLNREVGYLIALYSSLSNKVKNGRPLFEYGNGGKIQKRFIGLSQTYKFDLPEDDIKKFVFLHPGLREVALPWIAHKGFSRNRYEIVRDYLLSGHCMDDASIFWAARCLVELDIPFTKKYRAEMYGTAKQLQNRDKVGLISAIWILSKYGTQAQVFEVIDSTFEIWSLDEWVGRQIGAMFLRLYTNPALLKRFESRVRMSKNTGAQRVFRALSNILTGRTDMPKVLSYLRAPLPSRPRGISHTKILMSSAFLRSTANSNQKMVLRSHLKSLDLDKTQKYLLRSVLK